jgi:uncharacterized protein (TIGR03089 family)
VTGVLASLTAGLVADRDLAQPLITYVEGPARIELSGSTAANWICKTANLLRDGYGGPDRVGILLPLHWQTPCLLLGAVAAGATAVVAATPEQLAGCSVAFTTVEAAEPALDAGVEEVFACSLTPFATRLAAVPAGVSDAAVEIPGYGDHFNGRPAHARVEVEGQPFDVPALDVSSSDRVLTAQDPRTAQGLAILLGALQAGAAVVLLREGEASAVAAQEGVTRSFS